MVDVSIDDYTIIQLRAWLRHLNLASSGNKAALVVRLNAVPPEERGVCPILENDDDQNVPSEDEGDQNIEAVNREMALMRREMALMAREQELLQRENELLRQSVNLEGAAAHTPRKKNDFSFSAVKDLLPEFNGSGNVDVWISQLMNISKMCELKEDVLKVLLLCKLKNSALNWLHSKTDFVSAPFDILIEGLREAFKPQGGKLQQRRKFENRKWVYGENFTSYYNEKMLMANDLLIKEDELIEHLVEGISDLQLRTQATIQCFDSAEKLLRAFASVEMRKPYQPGANTRTTGREAEGQIRCFNCNSVGHFAANCEKPKREMVACFGCGSMEHKITTCPQRKGVHVIQDIDYIQEAR